MAVGVMSWVGRPRVKGTSDMTQMLLLTISMIGLQFAWGTEMTYGTPYLLSLGLTKSKLSMVWVAGPLSGLVMQPIIGVISDKSTSKFGRRRPFMLGGAIAVAFCLIALGWMQDLMQWWIGPGNEKRVQSLTITFAVVDIYILDFVINIFSRMSGIGQLLVYAIGSLDLKNLLGGFLGDTQFKKVCLIAAIAMLAAQGLTCWAVEERILISNGQRVSGQGMFQVLSTIYSRTLQPPPQIQAICWGQFWSWIGWFPFLFYGSTWVGEIYLKQTAPIPDQDALTEVGRVGSVAFIVFAIISFGSSIVLPWLVQDPAGQPRSSSSLGASFSVLQSIRGAEAQKPTLKTAWILANILFAITMISAPLVSSVGFATVLIAFCGIPWTVAGWAPGTFLGVEVNKMNSANSTYPRRSSTAGRELSDDLEMNDNDTSNVSLHLRHDSNASSSTHNAPGELSGIYFGILNIYTTLPQFVGTAISWIVFSVLDSGEIIHRTGRPSTDTKSSISGIGVCLFVGALSAMGAAWAIRSVEAAS